MKRQIRAYLTAGISLLLAAAAGFGLPLLLLRFGDEQRLGRIDQEEVSRMEITEQPVLTIVEKIRLMQRPSSNSMVLAKGRNYDSDTIAGRIAEELDAMAGFGIPGTSVELEDAVFSVYPVFMMDVEGENSFIVWVGEVYAADGVQIDLSLDDETGKILSLSCFGSVNEKIGSGEETADSFGTYLGCHVAAVNVSDSGAAKSLDEKAQELYENAVQNRAESGSTWEDAQAQINEEWGLENPGYAASVTYGDESGMEVQYIISVLTESESLQILPR